MGQSHPQCTRESNPGGLTVRNVFWASHLLKRPLTIDSHRQACRQEENKLEGRDGAVVMSGRELSLYWGRHRFRLV